MSPAIRATLPWIGFVRTLPNKIIFGPRKIGGIDIQHLQYKQHPKQLYHVIHETSKDSIAKKLIVASLEELIVESGMCKEFWKWPREAVMKYLRTVGGKV